MTEPIRYSRVVRQYTEDGTWARPESLVYARVVIISGGGGGNVSRGGGGGGVVEIEERPATFWPDTATVIVGQGGQGDADGGASSFADVSVPGGKAGANGGAGAAAIIRGGAGSSGTGESTTSAPRSLLSGGGGGGATGGISGLGFHDGATLLYAGVLQCGRGGSAGQAGEWPAGGGGKGAAGADGCVTIIETHVEE